MATTIQRHVRLIGATGKIRVAQFENRDHLVFPVVALVEGVVHSANAEEPEFVPAHVLSIAPNGWDGRPVVGGHPVINGEFVSANSPSVLQRESFGLVFNAHFAEDRLIFESWVDPVRAEATGEIGKQVVKNLRAGVVMEVSVGAFVEVEEVSGTFNGKRYAGRWRSIVPDHLAILAEGDKGACSVEMGCGTLRSSMVNVLINNQFQALKRVEETPVADNKETVRRSLKERIHAFLSTFTNNADTGVSDNDVWRMLEKELHATEPAFLGVADVSQVDGKVVYGVNPNGEVQLIQRNFSLSEDGSLSLGDKREEVQPVTRFEPVRAESATPPEPVVNGGCGCHKKKEGEIVMNKDQRIQALIDGKRFNEADREWLKAVPEGRLSALEAAPEAKPATPPAEPPAPSPAPVPPVVNSQVTPQTTAQFLSSLSPEMREFHEAGLALATQQKTAVIAALKGTGRCTYSDQELTAMTLASLTRLKDLAGVEIEQVQNFVGRVGAAPAALQTPGRHLTTVKPVGLLATLSGK